MTNQSFNNIFEAAKDGTVEDVKYYIETQRVDVNTKDEKGLTPLHYVAGHNPNVEVAKYLVEHGADIYAKSDNGYTPLDVAWRHAPNEEVGIYFLDLMMGSRGVLVTDPGKLAEIMWSAAVHDDWNFVKAMLHAHPSLIDTTGKSPENLGCPKMSLLHLAVMQNADVGLLEYLVSAGADVNARYTFKLRKNITGRTLPPLFFAVSGNSNMDIVKYLVSAGANIHADKVDNNTLLHSAARKCSNVAVLEYLISQGAYVHAENKRGRTPLHEAAQSNPSVEVLKYLIDRGAHVHAQDKRGNTPLDIADTEEKRLVLREAMKCNNGHSDKQ